MHPFKKQAMSAAKDKKALMAPDKLPNATDYPMWAKYAEKGGKTGKAGYEGGADGHLAGIVKMEHASSNGYGRKELARKTKP